MQIFVQTDSHAIDVGKIEWMHLPAKGAITLHMDSGAEVKISRAEAAALMSTIAAMDGRGPVRAFNVSGGAMARSNGNGKE